MRRKSNWVSATSTAPTLIANCGNDVQRLQGVSARGCFSNTARSREDLADTGGVQRTRRVCGNSARNRYPVRIPGGGSGGANEQGQSEAKRGLYEQRVPFAKLLRAAFAAANWRASRINGVQIRDGMSWRHNKGLVEGTER